jgi:hypothetical protein
VNVGVNVTVLVAVGELVSVLVGVGVLVGVLVCVKVGVAVIIINPTASVLVCSHWALFWTPVGVTVGVPVAVLENVGVPVGVGVGVLVLVGVAELVNAGLKTAIATWFEFPYEVLPVLYMKPYVAVIVGVMVCVLVLV